MVSPQNPVTTSVSQGTVGTDRGFVPGDATTTAPSYRSATDSAAAAHYPYPTYFWGAVVAGTLFVMSLFALSYFLMLGCHVGVTHSGTLALGWGAAIWIVVTSCVAYYCGGLIANQISRPLGSGWLKGAAVWGLSIPLGALVLAIIAGGTGLLAGLTIPQTGVNAVNNAQTVANNLQPSVAGLNFGYVWTAFITLLAGLIFSVVGSGSAFPVNTGMTNVSNTGGGLIE